MTDTTNAATTRRRNAWIAIAVVLGLGLAAGAYHLWSKDQAAHEAQVAELRAKLAAQKQPTTALATPQPPKNTSQPPVATAPVPPAPSQAAPATPTAPPSTGPEAVTATDAKCVRVKVKNEYIPAEKAMEYPLTLAVGKGDLELVRECAAPAEMIRHGNSWPALQTPQSRSGYAVVSIPNKPFAMEFADIRSRTCYVGDFKPGMQEIALTKRDCIPGSGQPKQAARN